MVSRQSGVSLLLTEVFHHSTCQCLLQFLWSGVIFSHTHEKAAPFFLRPDVLLHFFTEVGGAFWGPTFVGSEGISLGCLKVKN